MSAERPAQPGGEMSEESDVEEVEVEPDEEATATAADADDPGQASSQAGQPQPSPLLVQSQSDKSDAGQQGQQEHSDGEDTLSVSDDMIVAALESLAVKQVRGSSLEEIEDYLAKTYPVTRNRTDLRMELDEQIRMTVKNGLVKQNQNGSYRLSNFREQAEYGEGLEDPGPAGLDNEGGARDKRRQGRQPRQQQQRQRRPSSSSAGSSVRSSVRSSVPSSVRSLSPASSSCSSVSAASSQPPPRRRPRTRTRTRTPSRRPRVAKGTLKPTRRSSRLRLQEAQKRKILKTPGRGASASKRRRR